ncbi:MAG TPA: M1 family aminopeptidase [Bryobacteraceae bacterium]|nr:M1 family aminopeptidase [Bryobacteraceae bacterium]
MLTAATAFAQDRSGRERIDVQSYLIDAKIDPAAQTLVATAMVRFTPLDNASTLSFELNNALSVSKVVDDTGREVSSSRVQQDMTVHVNLPQTLEKGKPAALTFIYDGKLTGNEESPVFGIKFAAIHPDFAYLMYPARWFPVNDYTTDRFSSDMKITVPAGFKVVSSDVPGTETAPAGMTTYRFKFDQKSFPGSLAVVKGEPVQINSGGITTSFYMRQSADMAAPYGDEIGRAMTFFTDLYGLPPKRNLTVVETEDGTPNGYSAPGLLFFSPAALGKQVNLDLVANQVARQWWGGFVSPTTRNHMWIENGVARYSEILYEQHAKGASAFENELRDTYVQALTVDQPPLIQSARLEDYSPEYWAATAGKGAAVLNMLRGVIGDDNFFRVLKAIPEKYPWGNLNTDDFEKITEDAYGQGLNWFFVEWIESSGAPEFKKEYTVFRTQKSPGFRVMGKITQDMDTFRMPITMRIETEGNPEEKKVEVVGTSSEFAIETFGKPKNVILDPKDEVLHFDDHVRVAVAIRRGEQFTAIGDYSEALKEYQKALDVTKNSSLAHYRVGELFFLQQNCQPAANEFREALNGDLDPKWTEVWAHIYLGKIFDISDQRDRALNEYRQALRTKDNTQGALEEAQKYTAQKFERPRMTN